MYDNLGAVTLVDAESVKNVYTVTTYRLLTQPSFNAL
jgi:hypothetical protein